MTSMNSCSLFPAIFHSLGNLGGLLEGLETGLALNALRSLEMI